MQGKYEVWRYSDSWQEWIRDVYKYPEEAQARYESLLRRGKKARAPRPFNTGLPLSDRVSAAFLRVMRLGRSGPRGYYRAGR